VSADAVRWHDLECGGYAADLPLWRELSGAAGGPVLDVGVGTGRVALDLARRGVSVAALDHDPQLLAAVRERAAGLPVRTVEADARAFALSLRFPLVIAAMQLLQLLGGRGGRAAFRACARRHLAPGGRLACALADPLEAFDAAVDEPPVPDMCERDGLVLSSQPVRVRAEAGGWIIERVRQVVEQDGAVAVADDAVRLDALAPAQVEAEGRAAGLVAAGRRRVPATADHVGSQVVILARG
jgi:SAM-dependent methyltransferase